MGLNGGEDMREKNYAYPPHLTWQVEMKWRYVIPVPSVSSFQTGDQ